MIGRTKIDTELKPSGWTFFSNHAHVLCCLVQQPDRTLRDVALHVGITERAVQRIVADLVDAGLLIRRKEGRRNVYQFDLDQPLRHPLEAHRTVDEIMALIASER